MPAKLTITTDLSGLSQLGEKVRRQAEAILDRNAQDVLTHAVDAILTGPKTGAMYGAHQASAPGEAPANDMGTLANSMTITKPGDLAREIEAPAEYAAALEFGRLDGTIAPRPFLAPALDAVKPQFVSDVAEMVKRAG